MGTRTRTIDARDEMIKAWGTYEKFAKKVAAMETTAENDVRRRGVRPGAFDYEVDSILDTHAYKHLVAVRNSARTKAEFYAMMIMAEDAAQRARPQIEMVEREPLIPSQR